MQIKPFALAILLCLTTTVRAEDPSSNVQHSDPHDASESSIREGFSYLSFLVSDETNIRAVVGYNSKTTTVINKKRSELPKSHPLYVADEFEADDVLLMETALGDDGKRYYLLFSEGPSADPEFYLINPHNPNKTWAELYGTALALPGNGAAYVAGRYDETFTQRSKYLYSPRGMHEVKQPFAYVGLATQTLRTMTLYSAPDQKHPVANLPAGTAIEVLLADDQVNRHNQVCLLIKTPFGLVGWAWVPYEQYNASTIDGISFQGD